MSKVAVGLSGGVDSAVTAYLLKAAGHEVIGITLRTYITDDGRDSRCCEIDDARETAGLLGIPYYVINVQGEFRKHITEPFIEEYLRGRTPSPCIICNRRVKFAKMLEAADNLGAEYIATGHYAEVTRLENGRYTVRQAAHIAKDQTYMLCRLTQQQLSRTLMPLGKLSKDEVREIARSIGLPVAEKRDSQELCFVPDDDYAGYIEDHAEALPPEGDFVDEAGNILGRHKGIYRCTVGQRKGLGLSLGYPAYVKAIDAPRNRVVIGTEQSLYTDTVLCSDPAFMGIPDLAPGETVTGFAKIRYAHKPQPASAALTPDGLLKLTFPTPVRAAAPGQTAVLYDNSSCILCSGTIL
ncbi:MAG: tRNA 2-thiouridine(34) synthase MnmA [Ruminococcus sp.]|nr:tRNA 2-thiouridine(34) synthase MnmA [Ruminococcus sp.]